MKTLRKILCVVLSLLMIVSGLSICASAAVITEVTGAEDASKINVKYEVEQVESAGDFVFEGGSVDSVYKVSIYAKAAYGIQYFQVPIYYDNTKFEVVMDMSNDPVTDELYLYEGWAADNGESAIYYADSATAFSDTSMYTSTGAVATSKAKARYVGLGSSNAVAVAPQWEAHDATSATFDAWTRGIEGGAGIAFLCLDNLGNAKNAYFNSYDGAVNTDWAMMGAMYFVRLPGVSAEEAVGSQFGAFVGGNGLEGLWDTSGNPSYFSSTYAEAEPGLNIVSLAVVEEKAEPSPVVAGTSQIRFNGLEAEGTGSAPIDVRTRAYMTAADFEEICGNDEAAKTAITDIGFVYLANGEIDVDTAKAVVAGTSTAGTKAKVDHIQKKDGNYIWTCLLAGADYDATLSSVGYIVVNGETYLFDAAYGTDISELYGTYYSQYAATKA